MKLFCQYDRFDLEQDIIKLWETNEAIDELIRQHLDRPEGPFSDDEFANRLDGIKYTNDMKIQRIWDGFEVMLKNGHFNRWDDSAGLDKLKADIDVEILLKKKKEKK
jgi:hypothetical protein